MPRKTANRRGGAMMEFLLGCSVLLLLVMGSIQLSLLWASQGAVETAAHLAARKFALFARTDFPKAKAAALAEATSICLHRPGGRWGSAHLTSIDFSRRKTGTLPQSALAGEAFCLRLTHWVELCVPWVNRILFSSPPGKKAIILGPNFFL